MRDPYLYEGTRVLKNKLGITSQEELDRAEADYVSWRLKQLAMNPLPGAYTTQLFLDMHKFIFQDLYDWAGCIREINIEKEEPALGGLSIEYADISTIRKDLNSAMQQRSGLQARGRQYCATTIQAYLTECSDGS